MNEIRLDPYLKHEILELDYDHSRRSIYKTKYLEGY